MSQGRRPSRLALSLYVNMWPRSSLSRRSIVHPATIAFSHRACGTAITHHPIDRREHLRIPVRLYLSFSGGKVRGEGTVLDLSMGGCIIKSETQVHTDDIFYLQLSLDETELPVEVAGMVRSVSPRGIAFKFLRAAQENKRLLAFVQAQIPDQPDKSSGKVGIPA